MPHMVVVDLNGTEHIVEGRIGSKLMELLRDLDYGVSAVCGGQCACATCHVYIDDSWMAQLPAKSLDEQDALSYLAHYRDSTSRLSCQLLFTAQLHGLRLAIAPDE